MPLNLAIDSLPLSDSLFRSYDYSGLQVHLLTNTPLADFLKGAHREEQGAKTSLLIPIQPSCRWADGEKLEARHYAAGLLKASQENPFVGKFLLRHLTSVQVSLEGLVLQFRQTSQRLTEVLSIPSIAAFRESSLQHDSCGKWMLKAISANSLEYLANPYQKSPGERLTLHLVKDPEANLRLFWAKKLDVTADTAFPFAQVSDEEVRKHLLQRGVGLQCHLSFAEKLAEPAQAELRRNISAIASNLSFKAITHGVCPTPGLFDRLEEPQSSFRFPRGTLVKLAYDDFYPNKDVAMSIASALRKKGLEVEVLEDNYYKPQVACDIRLGILRAIAPSPYLLYAALLFSPALRASKELQLRYAQLLAASEEEVRPNFAPLRRFVAEHALLCPLFEIPSLCLSRNGKNPLTERLVHPL
jgi:MarR-like DNA-binding transcriptional regulator SgrR of sgrS sRNA